jgi:hypothetical protein
MADVFDQVPPDRTRLRLERIWSLREEATELERLRAVVPVNPTHAAVIRERIEALEGRLPEARDYFGVPIRPGVRVVYASTWRPRLGHGTVVSLEPYRGRLQLGRVVQVHIKTESGPHVRIVDPERIVVLNTAASPD